MLAERWRRLLGLLVGAEPVPRTVPPPRRTRRSRRGRDFQRARVYRWEGEHVLSLRPEPLDLDACRALVREAYLFAERPDPADRAWAPPEVTDGRGRRHACGSRQVIKLPRWARTAPVVLHECAHGLAKDKHGPGFVRVYVTLLERFLGFDPAVLEASLAAAGVQIGPRRRAPASGMRKSPSSAATTV